MQPGFLPAVPESYEAKVETAILRDFSRALSKLVSKVEKREAELGEAAKRQPVTAGGSSGAICNSPPAMPSSAQILPAEWGSPPPMANGGVQAPGASLSLDPQVVANLKRSTIL